MISQLLDLVLHVDKHLQTFAQEHGVLIYVLLFAIIFCETGLIVTPFLPGDSLLFAVGALSAQGFVRIEYIIPLLIVAAIIGDNFNYWIGRKAGGWIVQQRWFRRDYLSKTEAFFVKHGGKAVVLARFVPIVRTFTPVLAGVSYMRYPLFLGFDIIGGILWGAGMTLLGYFLGNVPFVKENLEVMILLIVFLSIMPGLLAVGRNLLGRR